MTEVLPEAATQATPEETSERAPAESGLLKAALAPVLERLERLESRLLGYQQLKTAHEELRWKEGKASAEARGLRDRVDRVENEWKGERRAFSQLEAQLRAQIEDERRACRQVESQLQAVLSSTTWRLMAPVRKVLDVVRGRGR